MGMSCHRPHTPHFLQWQLFPRLLRTTAQSVSLPSAEQASCAAVGLPSQHIWVFVAEMVASSFFNVLSDEPCHGNLLQTRPCCGSWQWSCQGRKARLQGNSAAAASSSSHTWP